MSRLGRTLRATATVRSSGSDHPTAAAATNTAHSVPAPPPEAVTLESDFVVILAALLCALIGVVGLIAVARCSCLRRGGGGVSEPRTPANKGLKKKVLQSLPKFTYNSSSNDNSSSIDNNENNCSKKWMVTSDCAICLTEFQEGDEIRVLPQCGHGFHLGCIDAWLVSHSSCPSCRQILVVPRCQKCGLYPAIAGTGHGRDGGVMVITVEESEMKAEEAGNATEVSASGEGQHQADNDNGGENTQ